MTAFVTGATGFIGQHVVATLLGAGRQVRILTRDCGRVPEAWYGRVEVVRGDLSDAPFLASALAGVSVLFNLAGEIRQRTLFHAVNEAGVQHLLEAVTAAGVKKVVHLSSVGVIGARRPGVVADDAVCAPHNEYERSKYRGEEIVRSCAAARGIAAVIVRPTIVFGEGKRGHDSLLAWLHAIAGGRFAFVGTSGIANYLYVQDLAAICVELAARDCGALETYTIADPTTIRDFVAACADALVVPVPQRTLPASLTYAVAAGMEMANRLFGTPTPLTVSRVEALSSRVTFSGEKLATSQGLVPQIGFRRGLTNTVRWYRDHGLLPTGSAGAQA